MGQWLSVLICVLLLLKAEGVPVGITFVENAVAKGAGEKFLLFLGLFIVGLKLMFEILCSLFGWESTSLPLP